MVFHRCVIAVIGVLAIGTSATAGPVKFGERTGPSLDVAELRANGVRMGQQELRALFFRGGDSRNATASCGECLAAESSLRARDRNRKSSDYKALFPFSSVNLFTKPVAARPLTLPPAAPAAAPVPDLIAGPAAAGEGVTAVAPPVSNAAVGPVAVAAPVPAPEPATFALLGAGLAGVWLARRRNRVTLP
jgi:hypothetical protein